MRDGQRGMGKEGGREKDIVGMMDFFKIVFIMRLLTMSVVHKWIRTQAMREKWLYIRMHAQLVQSIKWYLAVQEGVRLDRGLIDSLEKRLVDQDTLLRRVQWELVHAVQKEKEAVKRADSLERRLESQDIMLRGFVTRAGDLVESPLCKMSNQESER